ncbi:ABC transporter ATP-binding protein [Corynebacterium aquilae]|uniref:ATP-binding protein n=1 Tax=Corynebacterium aquilae DSM 44791 TaxID=1431546 RepID=A0A1L7CHU9_9CORY|nr:ABC transporter ATP-binding protein [Corynebacterium aquilae]APT85432.1 ATP-binding protein [Corynebacterium aquilae DSM 44791]
MKLTIEDLECGYGKKTVLEKFTPRPLTGGKVVGLLGPNASGKSTMIKTLAGVHRKNSGHVSLVKDGKAITGKALRKHIGYVPQDLPGSASLTAFETVLVAARRATTKGSPQQNAADTMVELGIGHIADSYIGELSGGQRQLVAVAQMLVAHPDVMLLDEPTSALDLHRQLYLLNLVRERTRANQGITMVAIHDINLAARFCDELLVMRQGTIIAQGAPCDTLNEGLIKTVYDVAAEILDHEGTPVVSPVGL